MADRDESEQETKSDSRQYKAIVNAIDSMTMSAPAPE